MTMTMTFLFCCTAAKSRQHRQQTTSRKRKLDRITQVGSRFCPTSFRSRCYLCFTAVALVRTGQPSTSASGSASSRFGSSSSSSPPVLQDAIRAQSEQLAASHTTQAQSRQAAYSTLFSALDSATGELHRATGDEKTRSKAAMVGVLLRMWGEVVHPPACTCTKSSSSSSWGFPHNPPPPHSHQRAVQVRMQTITSFKEASDALVWFKFGARGAVGWNCPRPVRAQARAHPHCGFFLLICSLQMEELREGLTMHLQKLKELEESHSRAVEDTVQDVAAKILRHSKRVAEHTVRWNPAIGICVVRAQPAALRNPTHPWQTHPSVIQARRTKDRVVRGFMLQAASMTC